MRLAIIDDHPIVIEGLTSLSARMVPPPVVSGFDSIESFKTERSAGTRFDLVLLDLMMPGHAGLSALRSFREHFSDLTVVVLSATNDPTTIFEAVEQLNATGYIPKTSRGDVLVGAIELILRGGIYVPPEILLHPQVHTSTQSLRQEKEALPAAWTSRSKAAIVPGLTARQRDVFNQLLKGLPDKSICRVLDLSINTVKQHKGAVFRAFGVNNRASVIVAAQKLGIRVNYEEPERKPTDECDATVPR